MEVFNLDFLSVSFFSFRIECHLQTAVYSVLPVLQACMLHTSVIKLSVQALNLFKHRQNQMKCEVQACAQFH